MQKTKIRDLKSNFDEFLVKNFKKIGIKKNDCIYLGVNMGNLFKPFKEQMSLNGNVSKYRKILSNILFDSIKTYIGSEGTIICPTFSFSFIRSKRFDKKRTKSDLGFFTSEFFKKRGVFRTQHPTHSIAIWGKKKNLFKKNFSNFCFGLNSPFAIFKEIDLKFVNLGIELYNSITYIHHLEHLNGSFHRYYKPVTGYIKINNKVTKKKIFTFVRIIKKNFVTDASMIQEKLLSKKKLKLKFDKNVYFSSVSCNDVHNLGLRLLNTNPVLFMKYNS